MIRILIIYFAIVTTACAASGKYPTCLGEICFGRNELPSRSSVEAALGFKEGLALEDQKSPCFKDRSGGFVTISYFDHGMPKGSVDRVLVAVAPVCKPQKNGALIEPLKLDKSIALGAPQSDLYQAYGEPALLKTGKLLKQYKRDAWTKAISADAVAVYGPEESGELLAATIFLKKKKIVAMMVGESK